MKRALLFAFGMLLVPSLGRAEAPGAHAKGPVPPPPQAPAVLTAHADIRGLDGKKIGEVKMEETPHGVLMNVELSGAPAGQHAFHIHEVGKCEAPFKTAGGHFNPEGHKHGIKAPEGKHAGDMPNVDVPADGKLKLQLWNHDVTLKAGEKNSVFDADGSALVLHKSADDNLSDPAGAAGDRIACGVIERDGGKK